MSELVTNAVKYAFPAGRPGKVVVRLDVDGDHTTLSVADDGTGLPALIGKAGNSVGIDMVKGLADQIGGKLDVISAGGTRYTLRFKSD